MGIWGKLIGGTSGFALGGPLGGLLGGIAGHAIDRLNNIKLPEKVAIKQIGFTIGIIALSAKMAKADGIVTETEVKAFRKHIFVPDSELKNVGRVWSHAKKSTAGFEVYASQLLDLFHPKSIVLEQILHLLFKISISDGDLSKREVEYISMVNKIFGFEKRDFDRMLDFYLNENLDPYQILGVKKNEKIEIINKKRLELIKQYHPDKLLSLGLPEEFLKNKNDKLKIINKAWSHIKSTHKS